MRILAVDIGTNSVRYLTCDISTKGEITVIERGGEITRLGEGIDSSGMLKHDAILRTAKAIKRIIGKNKERGIDKSLFAATSAARDAENSFEFIQCLKDEAEAIPKILSGKEEAETVYRGVTHELPRSDTGSVIVDIGGGSSEFIYPGYNGNIAFHSVDVGAVRMTERFIKNDPLRQSDIDDIRGYVEGQFKKSFPRKNLSGLKCIGVGGTITTLASIHLEMPKYDHDRVHGYKLPSISIHKLLIRLSSCALDEREKIVGLQPERADIIVAGAVILDALLDFAAFDSIRVSDRGILFGLALTAAGK